MPPPIDIHRAGSALVEAASSAPQSPGDIVRELFPYIWQASRKMSTRKISDWLKREQDISLSQATVSRALRHPAVYWEELADKIEPASRVIREITSSDPIEFLFDEECFEEMFRDSLYTPEPHPGDEDFETYESTRCAIDFLRAHWFVYSSEVRANCRRFVETEDPGELEERQRQSVQEQLESNY